MLNISSNFVFAMVPSSIVQLTNLEILDASQNLFTGTIPVDVGGMRKLSILSLNNNFLIGSISHIGELLWLTSCCHCNQIACRRGQCKEFLQRQGQV
mmetsp:Transcript_8600/g.19908  ORF Transcript_8600/g.19908 Transcript_8600/m.19908 type:complete len:97 (-) Transcript_8600:204-494(-)